MAAIIAGTMKNCPLRMTFWTKWAACARQSRRLHVGKGQAIEDLRGDARITRAFEVEGLAHGGEGELDLLPLRGFMAFPPNGSLGR